MDGAFVKIQDDELKALCSRLNEMALSPDERKSLLASIGEEIMTQTKDRLAEKKTPDGDKGALPPVRIWGLEMTTRLKSPQ